ncbi:hypothetical protein AAFC00_005954 [Neodothiora populina]|uniref:Uncharacterized protein n=1 Tax=Neodothiora populina TaxID=2781224 RepID=A0ABR3P6G5_9PEZI
MFCRARPAYDDEANNNNNNNNPTNQAQTQGRRNNPALGYQQEADMRRRQTRRDEALARRLQREALDGGFDQRRNPEQEVFGNAGDHFLNENFVQEATNLVMGALGNAGYGRRGERESGRLRGPPRSDPLSRDLGLAPNAFGTESVLGFGPPRPPRPAQNVASPAGRRRDSLLRSTSKSGNGSGGGGGGDFIGRWLSKLG